MRLWTGLGGRCESDQLSLLLVTLRRFVGDMYKLALLATTASAFMAPAPRAATTSLKVAEEPTFDYSSIPGGAVQR